MFIADQFSFLTIGSWNLFVIVFTNTVHSHDTLAVKDISSPKAGFFSFHFWNGRNWWPFYINRNTVSIDPTPQKWPNPSFNNSSENNNYSDKILLTSFLLGYENETSWPWGTNSLSNYTWVICKGVQSLWRTKYELWPQHLTCLQMDLNRYLPTYWFIVIFFSQGKTN